MFHHASQSLVSFLTTVAVTITVVLVASVNAMTTSYPPQLLSDPFLESPTPNSIQVVWFTEFQGSNHFVRYGQNLDKQTAATTSLLSRTYEDQASHLDQSFPTQPQRRLIWRHEATITPLKPNQRLPYRVTSIREDQEKVTSDTFTLSATPPPETSLKILLTSDHQLKPLTSANLQKVEETIGQVDGVFLAGDLTNIPDRGSEWFDDSGGNAFFPNLQGTANYPLTKNGKTTVYKGGKLIQNAPMFIAIGNHEVMGRYNPAHPLNEQFRDAFPRTALPASQDQNWIKNRSYNTDTVNEIFNFPGEENYYAVTFGDIRLVVLYATNIWRSPAQSDHVKGKYQERQEDFNHPEAWGYGQHIFEPIHKGSQQYQWLEAELNSPEFKQATYKIVMLHHPLHSLGENITPAYTNPVQRIERDTEGNIQGIRYEYPQEDNYLIRDVVPLLEQHKVQLVFYGHSHLWNRFVSSTGMHFLETSNVGNSYGAYLGEKRRNVPEDYQENYAAIGNPYGLEPIIPTVAPLLDEQGKPKPYIASNDITVFSVFETETGVISSYYFDTRKPHSDVVKFDEFRLNL
jgi:hypothetical protein